MGLTYQAFMIDFLEKRRISVINGTPEELDFESRQEKRILEEARSEYLRKKKEGYTRKQAFDDLLEVQEEIAAQLESSACKKA